MSIKKILNHKVIKSASWYTVTNFFLKGIAFLTIPIFTRLLTTSDYGIVSVYGSWVGILSLTIGFCLHVSIMRAKHRYSDKYDEFTSSITFLSLIIFLVFLTFLSLFNSFFQRVTGLSTLLFYLMIFQAFFTHIQNLAATKFRYEYKYKVVSIASILTVISGIFLSIFLIINVFQKERYLGKILGNSSLIIIVGVFFLIYLFVKGKTFIEFEYWKYALVLSTPLIFHSLSHMVNNQFDRILINKYIGNSATGIYSFAYNIGMIINVIFVSLDQAWAPWFHEKFRRKSYKEIKERAKNYRDFFSLIYTLVLMISPELVKIMAEKTYWGGLKIVPWIAMSYYFMFIYSLEVNVEHAYEKTGLIPIGTIISAIINIGLNIILIPRYGYVVAAITTVISFFCLFLFHFIVTSKLIKHTVYGFKFHLQSIMHVLIVTIYFMIFEGIVLVRIFGIFVAIGLFYKSIKAELAKY